MSIDYLSNSNIVYICPLCHAVYDQPTTMCYHYNGNVMVSTRTRKALVALHIQDDPEPDHKR